MVEMIIGGSFTKKPRYDIVDFMHDLIKLENERIEIMQKAMGIFLNEWLKEQGIDEVKIVLSDDVHPDEDSRGYWK